MDLFFMHSEIECKIYKLIDQSIYEISQNIC